MGRPVSLRPIGLRPAGSRPRYSRPVTAVGEVSSPSITIDSAVFTWTGFNAGTLTCALSGAPGDLAETDSYTGTFTINVGAQELNIEFLSVSGTTLTLKFSAGTTGSNYLQANDLFNYGGDEPQLPNVSAAVNLPVTFTGGALAVPSGSGTYDAGAETLVQTYSINLNTQTGDMGASDAEGVWTLLNLAFGDNPAQFQTTGNAILTVTLLPVGAVPKTGIARWTYLGTNTAFLDHLSRPVPPHADTPLDAA